MPTEVHDCHQDWIGMEFDNMLAQSFLTAAEKRVLRTRVGTSGLMLLRVLTLANFRQPSKAFIKGHIHSRPWNQIFASVPTRRQSQR